MKQLIMALSAAVLMANGAAAAEAEAPRLEFAFEELVTLAHGTKVGTTPLGERTMIPITGGTFTGPGISGTIVPGGWDWQLRRSDGCTSIEADYMLRTDDGVIINVINKGVLCRDKDGGMVPARTQPVFEAPLGKYEWLGRTAFIGTLEPATAPDGGPAVRIKFYKAV